MLYEKKRKIKEALEGKVILHFTFFRTVKLTHNSMRTFNDISYSWLFGPEGKPIPTELRNEEATLRQEIDLEDELTASKSWL